MVSLVKILFISNNENKYAMYINLTIKYNISHSMTGCLVLMSLRFQHNKVLSDLSQLCLYKNL